MNSLTLIARRWYAVPDRADLRELLRPWKLSTFAIAMALLLYGAMNFAIGDWDVGITLIMGFLTYVFAPSSVRALIGVARQRSIMTLLDALLGLMVAWIVIDGVYIAYHSLVGNPIYRADNARASTPIYFMAGMFWLYRGSLRQFVDNLRALRAPAASGTQPAPAKRTGDPESV